MLKRKPLIYKQLKPQPKEIDYFNTYLFEYNELFKIFVYFIISPTFGICNNINSLISFLNSGLRDIPVKFCFL